MKNVGFDALFQQFQQFIYDNKECIKHFEFAPNHSAWLDFLNPLTAKGFWFILSSFLNILAIQLVLNSAIPVEQSTALISMLSLLFSIASRSPIINRIVFILSGKFKHYLLHQIVYQLGLFHRYMAITSFTWLLIHIINKSISKPYIDEILLFSLLALLCIIILTAIQAFRTKMHGLFENIHRYFSYTALILLISYFHITCLQQGISYESYAFKAEFYILLLTTILSISPWFGLKKIYPILQHAGEHVAAFKLSGKPQYGSFTRITLGDCQFHSFGDSVFDVNDNNCFTLFITAAGDRTKAIVKAANNGVNLIKECAMRRDRSYGFMYHVAVYDTVLIVATGGGIAPVLPHIALNKNTNIIVLWLGHDQVKEFSNQFLLDLRNKINTANIRIHMLNSSTPWVKNMSQEETIQFILQAYEHYHPEALFIVSNPALTNEMLKACRQKNIKGYGATFDS